MIPPFLSHYGKARQHVTHTVRYNETGQRLDVWRPDLLKLPPTVQNCGGAPVFFFVPGGAWMVGRRRGQAHELMAHLVERGWICVAIDYRTAPADQWPAPLIDVKTALNWTQDHIADLGGDPNFIVVAGASAGGHMASLAGLTPDRPPLANPPWHDVYPAAVVSLYGVYDWAPRDGFYNKGFTQILEKVIVGKSPREHPEIYRDASPIHHVRPDAPPFLVIHGTSDVITPVAGARRFVKRLRAVSHEPVCYREIPGAHHAFDLINPAQSKEAIQLIDTFLTNVRKSAVAA